MKNILLKLIKPSKFSFFVFLISFKFLLLLLKRQTFQSSSAARPEESVELHKIIDDVYEELEPVEEDENGAFKSTSTKIN